MITNNVKVALRNVLRHKVFSMVNIGGLALSLSAVWLIALFVADEVSYDRYHEKANRIYRLVSHGQWNEEKFDITGTSGLAAAAMKQDFPEVENTTRIDAEGGGVIQFEDNTFREDAIFFTDPSFFNIFTYAFIAGNQNDFNKPNTIVLTRSLATKLFGSVESSTGKTILLDRSPSQVAGVIEDVPANSHLSFRALRSLPRDYKGDWGNLSIYTYILLKPRANIQTLRAKMPAFVKKYMSQNQGNINFTQELQPLTAIHLHSHLGYELGENRDVTYVYVLSIVGFLILAIALINYVNITTARASVRLKEVALRKIIGSGRKNLIALFLTESLVVIVAAAAISLLLAALAMPLFNDVSGKQLSLWRFGVAGTGTVMLSFAILCGIIGGLYPATFLSKFKAIPALKNDMGNVKRQSAFRMSLVTFQFTVTVVMITCSLVIYLQLDFVRNSDLGFNKNQVLTFHLDSREVRSKVPALRNALLENPLIKAVSSAGNPIGNNNIGMVDYSVEKNGVVDNSSNLAYGMTIDPDFIPSMQIKLIEGRNFSKDIASDSNDVIVNEAFIKKQGWASGMGKRLTRGPNTAGNTVFANIIGVVKDFHIYSLQHAIEPMIVELPHDAIDRDNIYVRIDDKRTAESIAYIEKTFRDFDQSSPFDYRFLDQNFSAQYKGEENQGLVLLAFTLLIVCIACLGLFGLITFTVGKRVKEIGIRKVLGGSVTSIVTLLTGRLMKMVAISLLVAVPLSWLVSNRWLENFAYRIELHWWIFAISGFASLLISMLTLSVQAIKAAVANPAKSLRTE